MIIYGRYWLVDTIPYNLKAFPKLASLLLDSSFSPVDWTSKKSVHQSFLGHQWDKKWDAMNILIHIHRYWSCCMYLFCYSQDCSKVSPFWWVTPWMPFGFWSTQILWNSIFGGQSPWRSRKWWIYTWAPGPFVRKSKRSEFPNSRVP